MNIFKFWKLNKGKLMLIILLASVVILGTGKMVFAQVEGYTAEQVENISVQPAAETGKQVSVLLSVATTIAAKILTWVAALINFSLNIGNDVINLPIVQIGSRVVLNFANLGFVLAIIVIAFATIFRVQSYAMKQTLWKLIVAALLVNFSLVIAGAFISVSNIFTDFFLSKVTDADLATGLIGILNPQKLGEVAGVGDLSLASLAWSGFSYFLQYIASLFFVLVFTFLIILTFFAIFIMLLIRAIYLGILLIVMPLVWLAWIFPGTAEHWKKWWTEFLRWNFFAPAMLFFIYLVVATGKSLENIRAANLDNAKIAEAFGKNLTLKPGFFEHTTQLVIATGLLIGGLFVANKLGITFASTAYGWAQSAGKGVGVWAGRKGIRAGTWPLRRKGPEEGAKSLAERTGEWAAARKTGVGRYAAGWLARGTGYLARAGGEDLVKKAKERVKKMSLVEKKAVLLTADTPTRIAASEDLAVSKDLDGVDIKRLLTKERKTEFVRYGRGVQFNDIEKTVGRSVEMLEAALKKDTEALRSASDKFAKSLTMKDLEKGQWKDIYAKKPAFKLDEETNRLLVDNLTAAFAEHLPGAFAKINPKIKGKDFDNYQEVVNDQINRLEKDEERRGIPIENRKSKKARDSFEKNLGWLRLGIAAEEITKVEA